MRIIKNEGLFPMKTKFTRMISMLFAALMILTILPVSAFAAGNQQDVDANGPQPAPFYWVVRFVDWNGRLISRQVVENGHNAYAPANPKRPGGWYFVGWAGSYRNVTSDRVITAVYKHRSGNDYVHSCPASDVDINRPVPAPFYWTVRFVADGKVVSTQIIEDGHNAYPPTAPFKPGYVFRGWSSNWRNVTSDRTVNGYYKYIGFPNGFNNEVEIG